MTWRGTDESDAFLAHAKMLKTAVEREEQGALPSSEQKLVVEGCCHGNGKHKMSRL